MNEPTNAELMAKLENLDGAFIQHAEDDREVAKKQALVNERQEETNSAMTEKVDELHEKIDALPHELEQLIGDVFKQTIMSKGKLVYAFIIAAGGLVFALTALFGGIKVLLAWLGLSVMSK